MTKRLHFHFSLSYIEEGNGNPLQCSCLENPRDRGAWWAAICRVAQSRARLKSLSSSSSISFICESFTWYWIRKNDFYEKYFITILITDYETKAQGGNWGSERSRIRTQVCLAHDLWLRNCFFLSTKYRKYIKIFDLPGLFFRFSRNRNLLKLALSK